MMVVVRCTTRVARAKGMVLHDKVNVIIHVDAWRSESVLSVPTSQRQMLPRPVAVVVLTSALIVLPALFISLVTSPDDPPMNSGATSCCIARSNTLAVTLCVAVVGVVLLHVVSPVVVVMV